MAFEKKDVKKIQKASKEELNKLKQEYEAFVGSLHGMSLAGLGIIALAGVAIILYFQNNLLDLIGLVMLLYPLYIVIKRGAHREGYFEGYYEMMTKMGEREEAKEPAKEPAKPEHIQ